MYDIVIVDSGANVSPGENINGFHVKNVSGKLIVQHGNFKDNIGHGTIIYRMIRKYAPLANVCVVKVMDIEHELNEETLLFTLKYIKDNVQCRFINLSLGLRVCDKISEFKRICTEFVAAGNVIIAAFDNENCFSFPACFEEVIGVDNDEKINNITEYGYVESAKVNVRAKGGVQRIQYEKGSVAIASGSSIACAYISAYLVDSFKEDELTLTRALEFLKRHAAHVYNLKSYEKCKADMNIISKIKNAAVFPVSKEAHAFIRFGDMLHFCVRHYCDVRQSGRVGMKTSMIAPCTEDMCIEDIEKVNLEDVDTIILGHLDELNYLCGCDFREKILKLASLKSINVYSFDELLSYTKYYRNNFFYPNLCEGDVPQNTFGKLYKINKPVVGIFGTSSRQGKFSLQLTLKARFEKMGYRVGCVGTEPHSLLFNMDIVYPMGYNSSVFINPWESITYLNDRLFRLCEQNVEIVFVASQAGSAPQNYNNLMDYPVKQSVFLMGTHPDTIILCINIYDDINYIKNTIQVLQGLSDSKVIAFVMYPMNFLKDVYRKRTVISWEEFKDKSKKLLDAFGLPVYLLGDQQHMQLLCNDIIEFF